MRVLERLELVLLFQRGHLFPWTPVFLSIGIGAYFGLTQEPGFDIYVCLAIATGVLFLVGLRVSGTWSPLIWAVVIASLGFALAAYRAHSVAATVIGWRYYGAIEGRIVAMDRSASDRLRLTLDQVRLADVSAHRTPERVRISLHGDVPDLSPGQIIMTTGHLSPPQGPVEPGGFDFRRHAWFKQLGAVGYTRNPVLTIKPADAGRSGLWVLGLRMSISAQIQQVLEGDVGGFAAAVTTGDRSAVGQETLEALRASNLAHLLAISGLHMGLLTGFVFASLRMALSFVPSIALRLPVKKLAAIGALLAAALYLALSGGNVATERAFVMVSVMLGAVMVDRRAISLRAVAVAALIVLILRPEVLMSPGFQMSFAATTALVAVFGWLRDAELQAGPNWFRMISGIVISSLVAGLATAPVGAAHFNTLAHYGLAANLLSVPLMGMVVIPAAVFAACMVPLGLEWIGLEVMGLGLRWILGVAHYVAGMDGARGFVPAPQAIVLPMLALSGVWIILWQGRLRWIGIAPAMISLWIWTTAVRPDVLIAESGGLVGVMTEQGRALSKVKGSGFVAKVWLENDGDPSVQATAAQRWPETENGPRQFAYGDFEILHVVGKRQALLLDTCKSQQVIVSSLDISPTGDCRVFGPKRLRETGSLAFKNGQLSTSAQVSGDRLWNKKKAPRRRPLFARARSVQ